MEWQNVIALGGVLVAIVAMLGRAMDKSLSIREHEEFKASMRREIDLIYSQFRLDDDSIIDRVKVLEQTRPTTGELEARLRSAK